MKTSSIGRFLFLTFLAQPWLVGIPSLGAQTFSRARIFHAIADADEVPEIAQVPVRHTRSKDFVLPFNLSENEKSSATEIQLFVRTPDSPWQKRASAGPSEGKFEFKVLDEGEIWFAIVTCDSSGNTNPAEPRTMPPALRVLVDTTAPVFEMKVEPGKPPVNQPLMRLEAIDLNPDPQSISVACYTGGNWHALTAQPGDASLFTLPPAATGIWKIRAISRDKAGNQANFEGQFPPAENKKTNPTEVADKNTKPFPPAATPGPKEKATTAPGPFPVMPPVQTVNASNPVEKQDAEIGPNGSATPPPADKPKDAEKKTGLDASKPIKLVVNSTDAQLDYAIEEVGPSGIGKVDVWITKDNGLTWKILAEDTDGKSPANCKLPGEGEFGITLAITNGSGAQGKGPTPGEKPEISLEVDTTFPTAKLGYAQVLATEGKAGAALFVKWEAKDKNLGEKPIRLLLAESPAGPFIPFGEPLANTGEFRWPVPANIPPKMFLKMEVADSAGNITQVEYATPLLMDPARPKGKVLAVRAAKGTNETPSKAALPPANNLVPAGFSPGPRTNPTGEAIEPLAKPEPALPGPQDSLPAGVPPLQANFSPKVPKSPN